MTQKELIAGLKQGQSNYQKYLYDTYAPVLLGIVRRYIKSSDQAEDIAIEALYKIMTKIHQYSGKGSFEGWMKRIVVTESLMHLRKNNVLNNHLELVEYQAKESPRIENDLEKQDILQILDLLPTGYRTVFNLFVFEGYKHREIAEELNISINTSKSQLILAKKRLAKIVEKRKLYR